MYPPTKIEKFTLSVCLYLGTWVFIAYSKWNSKIVVGVCALGFSHLGSSFLGELSALCITGTPVARIGFLRRIVECKESRIGKRPIEVPSNVTITMEGQDLRVKGPLGELSRTYPREVKIEKEASGILRVYKAMETRRANQMHGLFR